jgi:hypothetical protein
VSKEARDVWEACVASYPEDGRAWVLFSAFEHRMADPSDPSSERRERALGRVLCEWGKQGGLIERGAKKGSY